MIYFSKNENLSKMNESKNWYAVYTRPRCEKKVASVLSRKNIENYCPLNRIQRQWSDRRKVLLEPLFTSCVFIQVTEAEHSLLKQVDGIVSMVYWLGKPAIIRENEIRAIKDFLKEYVNVTLEKRPINTNDYIRVMSGPLMEIEGNIVGIKARTIKVSLPSLGYMLQAEVEKDNVKIITPGVSRYYETQSERFAVK